MNTRKSINPKLKRLVWITCAGRHFETTCFCCNKNNITVFTGIRKFQTGHIISHKNGGILHLDNLLPICKSCNLNMTGENWGEYTNRQNYKDFSQYPPNLRYYCRYVKGIVWWQSLYRMYQYRSALYKKKVKNSNFTKLI